MVFTKEGADSSKFVQNFQGCVLLSGFYLSSWDKWALELRELSKPKILSSQQQEVFDFNDVLFLLSTLELIPVFGGGCSCFFVTDL